MKQIFTVAMFAVFLAFLGCEPDDNDDNPPPPKENNERVTASFEIEKLGNGEVKFKNLSENADTYLWDFGNSHSSTATTPIHTYDENGRYEVILKAANENDSDEYSATLDIDDIYRDGWTKIGDFPGGERSKALAFKVNGKYYVGFGESYGFFKIDLWEYDPLSGIWSQKQAPPDAISGGVSFVIGDYAYVGQGASNSAPNDRFWKYDAENDSWVQLNDFPGYGGHAEISGATAFSHEGYGYVLNGRETFTWDKEFWRYDPSDDIWTRLEDFPGDPRHLSSHFKIGDNLYVSGGAGSYGSGNTVFYNDLWQYNITTGSWTEKEDFPGTGRIAGVGFSIGGRGYVGLGWQGPTDYYSNDAEYFSDLWQYDPETDSWKEMSEFPDLTRTYAFVMEFEDKIWIGTGRISQGNENVEIWEYRIE